MHRKLRMALIGGGGKAFIGRVHATAATLDRRAELVAGALSSDPQKAQAAAPALGIAPQRAYGSYHELLEGELALPPEERIDFVSIATPNYTHFEIAKAALQAGFHVFCDKPMTTEVAQAEQLARQVEASGAVFVLTHNYTGYPLVRQARQMIRAGELGEIQAIRASYIQGWLRGQKPGQTPPRGAWKKDPAKAGPSGALADIGSHAFNLARYMTGLMPAAVCCKLMTYQPDQTLDDYGHALVHFDNDALAAFTVSQVTHGRLNDLAIEIDGSNASLAWRQEEPNQLIVRRQGRPVEIYERNPNAEFTNDAGRAACRLPGGHPEAFFEAFANVYCDGFDAILARSAGGSSTGRETVYPNVYDGVEGVYFIQQCVSSSREQAAWMPLGHALARGAL